MLNVGERTVRLAKTILDNGVPLLIETVESGKAAVSAVAQVAKMAQVEQEQIAARITQGDKPADAIREVMRETRLASVGAGAVCDDPTVTLICGDMLNVVPTLGLFDLVVADPPYNVTGWDWDKIGTPAEFMDNTRVWLKVVIGAMKPEYNLFWFCSPKFSADVEMVLRGLGPPIKSRIVWHRRNMAMGSDARDRFIDSWEMIFHCGTKPLNFPPEWHDDRFDVQTFAVPQTNFVNDTKYHPTQKPIELIRRLVEYGSLPGERVLDPFAGSGTTGEACMGTRQCVLIEVSDDYCRDIESRLGIVRHG
jgi:site-specific DNA-methyltransferase (adenine-specific)